MIVASHPTNEFSRLMELHSLNILDTEKDERFDYITQFAARGFKVPICLVSLVDTNRQWFKSVVGLDETETPRAYSFCAHAIYDAKASNLDSCYFEIYDTHKDDRFYDNPLVQGEPWVRSYLGCVLQSESLMNLGTLCLIDVKPRKFTLKEKQMLTLLGASVENLINGNLYTSGIKQMYN